MGEFQTINGPLLIPQPSGAVVYHRQGALRWDERGDLTFAGAEKDLPTRRGITRTTKNILLPPFLDAHIHIPQWPIRGKFCDGIAGNPPEGRLLAGLNRNVFPFEGKCSADDHAHWVIDSFRTDTLSKGVVGGSAYMTVHSAATQIALSQLSDLWHVGLVLMNINCPTFLRTDQAHLDRDVRSLAEQFGRRFIVTDRFAVSVDSELRKHAAKLSEQFGLRMQTHLNEQHAEKAFIEQVLYPDAKTYTNVYARDGLLQREAILAHCIHMSDEEYEQVQQSGSVIAHCPTSNTLLGSGVMPLDRVMEHDIPYAICTDVGASPTTSILCEMRQFVRIHAGRSSRATATEALFRTTLGAAQLLQIETKVGHLAAHRPASFIEVEPSPDFSLDGTAEQIIARHLLAIGNDFEREVEALQPAVNRLAIGSVQTGGPEMDALAKDFDHTMALLDQKVARVTVSGKTLFEKKAK